LFCPPKYFKFEDPRLQIRKLSGNEIEVRSEAYAKSVNIRNREDDLVLSDNFFDMNGGKRIVRVLEGSLEGLSVRSVYSIR